MRGLCHPIGRDDRHSKRSADCRGEFFVKRCAGTADEAKPYRRGTQVLFGGTVNENAVNRGHSCIPRNPEADYIWPEQVSREPARAREVSAAATCQSCQ